MRTKQFEIWLADLNPRFGSETGKTRPVLILQSDLLNKVHPSSIICPITTNIKSGITILRVDIPKGDSGLNQTSSVMIDQVRAIDNKRLMRKLGFLPKDLIEQVQKNLRIIMEL